MNNSGCPRITIDQLIPGQPPRLKADFRERFDAHMTGLVGSLLRRRVSWLRVGIMGWR